jgi:transcription elongation factor GreB
MSKAFVRDDAANDEDDGELSSSAPALGPGTKNYMTPAGHARMKAELVHLLHKERPEMVSVVSWAASNGDRSENGDYLYGKKRLREIDRRLRFLTKRLEAAEVVDPAAREATDQVFFGATVRYLDGLDKEHTVAIVGVDETDAGRGLISWISPLARALIKAREGDEVLVRLPEGPQTVTILSVKYQQIQV